MDAHWWNQAGGASFVELVTGINIALCGWEHFQNSVRSWGRRVDEIVGKALGDGTQPGDTPAKAAMTSLIGYNQALWVWVKRGAFISAIAGMVMLYLNRFCGWDFLLLLPLVCYWIVSAILLWIARVRLDGIVEYGKKYRSELESRTAPAAAPQRKRSSRKPRSNSSPVP